MTNRKTIKAGLTGLMILIVIALMASSLSGPTPSGANDCKDPKAECSQKNGADAGGDLDFESLSGKFFSSLSY